MRAVKEAVGALLFSLTVICAMTIGSHRGDDSAENWWAFAGMMLAGPISIFFFMWAGDADRPRKVKWDPDVDWP